MLPGGVRELRLTSNEGQFEPSVIGYDAKLTSIAFNPSRLELTGLPANTDISTLQVWLQSSRPAPQGWPNKMKIWPDGDHVFVKAPPGADLGPNAVVEIKIPSYQPMLAEMKDYQISVDPNLLKLIDPAAKSTTLLVNVSVTPSGVNEDSLRRQADFQRLACSRLYNSLKERAELGNIIGLHLIPFTQKDRETAEVWNQVKDTAPLTGSEALVETPSLAWEPLATLIASKKVRDHPAMKIVYLTIYNAGVDARGPAYEYIRQCVESGVIRLYPIVITDNAALGKAARSTFFNGQVIVVSDDSSEESMQKEVDAAVAKIVESK